MRTVALRLCRFGMASLLLGGVAAAQASEPSITLAVVGGRLIDGYGGTPLENSVILIAGDRVVAVGEEGKLPVPDGVRVVSSDGMTVMPGLIDLHVHYELLGHNNYREWFPDYRDSLKRVMPIAARIMLDAGVTSARDLGAPLEEIFWLREEVNSGRIPGPRTFIAGPFLRKSKGGATPEDYGDTWVVEDPEDGRQKVRRLVEMGVDVIKTQDEAFSVEELRAIYDEAHKLGKKVSTHLFTQPAVRKALQAGIGPLDTFEHIGDGPEPVFAPDIVQGVVESEVGVIPTEIAIDGFRQLMLFPELRDDPDFKASLPEDIWLDVRESYENFQQHPLFHDAVYERRGRLEKLRQLKKAGARFYLGTDSGTRGNPHHMAAWREMVAFTEFGLTPMETILASTFWPARVLGKGRDLGTIATGKLADIIIVDGDPLQTMYAMERVVHVIQGGEVVR